MVNVIIELIFILQIERKNLTLRPNAVPSLFDGIPSYLSNSSSGSRSSPSKRRRQQHTLNFLSEQLTLLFIHPKGRRYSIDMLICACAWYHKSPAYYLQIKKLLCLPRVRLLRSLSSSLDVGEENVSIKYLTRKAQCLEPHERVVNIQLDEIHIKSKLSYQSGKLIGTADNNDQKPATRIQCFMISAVLSNNKDVVSLIPVEKMKFQDLCKMTLDVTQSGFTIVSIISDNNIVNRKMFLLLSGTDHLVPYFINPYKTSNKIFMLFDTVHLLKCLRNNWINLKDTAKEFVFPDFSDSNVIRKACFAHMVTMYHMEKKSIVKEAYLLTWKALF